MSKKDIGGPLITALAAGSTVGKAAKRARCSVRTVARRQADPTFQAAVKLASQEIVNRATARLAAKSTAAADVLGRLLKSGNENIRLSAARWFLKLLLLKDHDEMERRITALEELYNRRDRNGN